MSVSIIVIIVLFLDGVCVKKRVIAKLRVELKGGRGGKRVSET